MRRRSVPAAARAIAEGRRHRDWIRQQREARAAREAAGAIVKRMRFDEFMRTPWSDVRQQLRLAGMPLNVAFDFLPPSGSDLMPAYGRCDCDIDGDDIVITWIPE